jgi:DNA processing protein
MKDADGLADWLRLVLTDGVGPQTARLLLSRFGLPGDVLAAGFPALQKCVPEKTAIALCDPTPVLMQQVIDATLAWAGQPDNHVLALGDAAYPAALLTIPDPPPVLYAKGRIELLARPSIAIVGSRNATAQGMQNAERFARALSDAGLTVVSGLALGIDAAAHQGACNALPGAGSTVAITGTGLDLVYPARHRTLAHRIAEHGCLLSEYPLGTPAIAANFPRRNRLISGLSLGTLVVEAALQSGSLITARSALEQGREVFAIPGSIHSPLAKGCHGLIRQGAKLVESAQDIIEELRWRPACLRSPTSVGDGSAGGVDAGDHHVPEIPAVVSLLEAAGHDTVSVDELSARSGMQTAEVQATLLSMELEGRMERLPDGRYQKMG